MPDTATATASLQDRLAAAIDLLRDDRLPEAERALQLILKEWPGQPDALHFQGVLRHHQGRSEEGIALIRQALEQVPRHAGAWTNLGNILLTTGQVDAAAQAYERSIEIADGGADAASPLCNLSTIYRKQGHAAEAEAACRRALELAPDFAEAWYNLSIVLMERGQVHDGLIANSRAITLWPQHLQARDQVIRALLLLGERERAAGLYREWLAEEPDNPVVQHQLAACLGEAAPDRASDAYVQQVFDTFSASFDAKLEALNYRAPELVTRALAAVAGQPKGRLDIVDAGCGTGLCGPLVKPWARKLAGCDLSEGMLRRALPRRVYDVLHQAELVYYMDTQPSRFDVVISADTLCYFGDLHAALAAAHRCLRPGGWLIFTVEALADGDAAAHRLQANGRYAHARAHIQEALAATGLRSLAIDAETLRSEAGRPVPGWLVSAAKP
ncbi:MAG: tetratricopeptide repeat protein [Aquabacterium sp.]|nr:tetratricopeptide repeat protein [Aquabacterium sp.]